MNCKENDDISLYDIIWKIRCYHHLKQPKLSISFDIILIAFCISGEMITTYPYSNVASLQSLAGNKLLDFAKSNNFKADLYHNLVAPTLYCDLLAETWQHDTIIGPSCKGFTVEDVSWLSIITKAGNVTFDNYMDHAKFAIGKTSDHPYVCIGDINREVGSFRWVQNMEIFLHLMLPETHNNLVYMN